MTAAFLDQLSEYVRGGVRQELAFPIGEYRRRVDRARGRMSEARLDALLLTHLPTICYLTGYQFTNCDYTGYLLLSRTGSGAMVVPGTEVGAVLMHGWVREVRDFPSWLPVQAVPIISDILGGWQAAAGAIGIESQLELMDPLILEQLRAALPQARFIDATTLLWPDRAVKDEAELHHITLAARYSDAGMLAAVQETTPASSENRIAAAAAEAMILVGSEFFATAPLVATGMRSGLPRTSFSRAAVPDAGPTVIELAGVYQRYCAPMMRTVLVPGSDRALKQLLSAAQAGIARLTELARPGSPISDVVRAARETVADRLDGEGISVPWSLGHSVGLCLPPAWDEGWPLLEPDAAAEFRTGMVFYSPIRLAMPRGEGIGFGDTWVVTEHGSQLLSAIPQRTVAVLAGEPS